MIDKNKVQEIATRVRKWAERSNIGRGKPFPSDLCGMCAIAAAKLFTELKKEGFDARIVTNDHHCFVQIRDWIIDVTATQFGQPPVLFIRRQLMNRSMDKTWWRANKSFRSARDLRDYQIKVGWPQEQTA